MFNFWIWEKCVKRETHPAEQERDRWVEGARGVGACCVVLLRLPRFDEGGGDEVELWISSWNEFDPPVADQEFQPIDPKIWLSTPPKLIFGEGSP